MLTLYNNIKKRREELGLTKVELATRIGYERSMITKIEQGKVDLTQSKIVAFAKALETTPANLMGWEDGTSTSTDTTLDYWETEENQPNEISHGSNIDFLLDDCERTMIEKYRELDDHGKEMVDLVLDKEYERSMDDYVELAAFGGKYKVDRKVAEEWAKKVVNNPCERDDDLC